MVVPGLLDLCPFDLWPPQAQCVIALDPALLAVLKTGAPQRSTGLAAHAAPQRRLEYLASRAGAAALLRAQGAASVEVTNGFDRAPVWPQGFTGSITHSPLLACVAVQPLAACASMGLDAQTILDDEAAIDVSRHCLRADEVRACVVKEPLCDRTLLTLMFSAKEAFFKCVYPLVRKHFDYTGVQVSSVADGRVHVRVLDSPGDHLPAGFMLEGTFQLAQGHAFTAFELRAGTLEPPV